MLTRLGVWYTLFKRDLKSLTAYPRFEILLVIYGIVFLFIALVSRIFLGPRIFVAENDFLKVVQGNFSIFVSYYIFILPPLLMTETVTGEVERGTMLSLLSYPVKRWQIFTSKLLASFTVTSVTIISSFIFTVILGFSYNNLILDLQIVSACVAALMLLCLILSSVASLSSYASNRQLVAAVSLLTILLFGSILVTSLASNLNWVGLQLYSYTELVKELAFTLMSWGGGASLFSTDEVLFAAGVEILFSLLCLGLSYLLFELKEFN